MGIKQNIVVITKPELKSWNKHDKSQKKKEHQMEDVVVEGGSRVM
jgi:hypothetical protein